MPARLQRGEMKLARSWRTRDRRWWDRGSEVRPNHVALQRTRGRPHVARPLHSIADALRTWLGICRATVTPTGAPSMPASAEEIPLDTDPSRGLRRRATRTKRTAASETRCLARGRPRYITSGSEKCIRRRPSFQLPSVFSPSRRSIHSIDVLINIVVELALSGPPIATGCKVVTH